MRIGSLLALSLITFAAACGDDGGGGSPDADTTDDPDAEVAPDAPPASTCDHDEVDDTANDAAGEATGVTVGATAVSICGQIDARVPDPDAGNLVDVDAYTFAVPAGTTYVRVRVTGVAPGALEEVFGFTLDGEFNTLAAAPLANSHITMLAGVAEGNFNVAVQAANATQPGAALPYEISITAVDPADCMTATATFTEANDGAANTDNDMVNVDWSPFATPQTAVATDVPEPTGATVEVGTPARFDGTLATPNGGALDEYLDKDTFVFTTGAGVNELDVKVTWPDADADLDFFLFTVPAGTDAPQDLMTGSLISNTAPEFQTVTVDASTEYWVWVGNYDGSAEPKAYEITLCSGTYAP